MRNLSTLNGVKSLHSPLFVEIYLVFYRSKFSMAPIFAYLASTRLTINIFNLIIFLSLYFYFFQFLYRVQREEGVGRGRWEPKITLGNVIRNEGAHCALGSSRQLDRLRKLNPNCWNDIRCENNLLNGSI